MGTVTTVPTLNVFWHAAVFLHFLAERYAVDAQVLYGFSTELPVYDGINWKCKNSRELYLEDKGLEQWKTHFYKAEDWNPQTGYPEQKTLEKLGMKHVADMLQANDRLG
jgi:hypothetical protein